jgi:hypothetical protein
MRRIEFLPTTSLRRIIVAISSVASGVFVLGGIHITLILPMLVQLMIRLGQEKPLEILVELHGTLAFPALASVLDERGNFYVSPVQDHILRFGDAAVPSLITELNSTSRGSIAAGLLAQLGIAAVAPLIERIENGTPLEKSNALSGFGVICEPAGMLKFLEIVERMPAARQDYYFELVSPPCAKGAPERLEQVVSLLEHRHLGVRFWASNVLVSMGKQADPAVETLLKLAHQAPDLRWLYLSSIITIEGVSSYGLISAILNQTSDYFVIYHVLNALSDLPSGLGGYCDYLERLKQEASSEGAPQSKQLAPKIEELLTRCQT